MRQFDPQGDPTFIDKKEGWTLKVQKGRQGIHIKYKANIQKGEGAHEKSSKFCNSFDEAVQEGHQLRKETIQTEKIDLEKALEMEKALEKKRNKKN